MQIALASLKDAEEILHLQKLAYRREAEMYQDLSIPPLTQSLAEITRDFRTHTVLKASAEGHIWGSVRAHTDGSTCYIGRLIVHPEKQGKGIGSRLLSAVEEMFPTVLRYELFTGSKSLDNLRLYHRFGYRPFKEKVVTDRLSLIFLEKPGKANS